MCVFIVLTEAPANTADGGLSDDVFGEKSAEPETADAVASDPVSSDQPAVTDPMAAHDPVATAVAESHSIHQLRQTAFRVHEKRLDTALVHNGLQRVSIAADGNCFFHAAALHVLGQEHQSLRENLCQHMEDNIEHYEGFFEAEDDNKRRSALDGINQLRTNGAWNTEANDILPLALANMTKRRIKVFTSKINTPHYDIIPTIGQASVFRPIYLALLAPRGQPAHYDGCLVKEGRSIYTEFADTSRPARDAEPVAGGSRDTLSGSSSEDTDTENNETPRRTDVYETPPKKRRGRKRTATPGSWKRNMRKHLRLTGQEFTNSRGKKVGAKQVGKVDCSKCQHKCSEKITDDDRESIFQTFYKLADNDRQKDFVCHHVQQKQTRRYLDEDGKPVENKRSVDRRFFLTVGTNSTKIQVCKRFFEATLAISHSYIKDALTKSADGAFCGSDGRGKSTPANKTPEAARQRVRDHIQSFPTVESHYARKNTGKLYLDCKLNVSQMHRLYTVECERESIQPVSESLYRNIFDHEFNISFHIPKKDQCLKCHVYNSAKEANALTPEIEEDHKEHLERKVEARFEKQKDVKDAQKSPDLHVASFDLQKVLQTPFDPTSMTYYKRKLHMYNLTVFSMADQKGYCYMWTEVEGQRGSNEIGTCIYKYLESLPRSVQHVIFYSDTCTGQNRNQFMTAALHHAVNNIPHIKIIEQKYLESGHTQMEADSIHACIEKASKGVRIYHPDQWMTVAQCAKKKGEPYTVLPLTHEAFFDFKTVAKNRMHNTKQNVKKEKVDWLKIKCLRVIENEEDTVFYKYRLGDNFQRLKITGTTTRRNPPATGMILPSLYSQQVPISNSKKKDLLSLCTSGVIPGHHHDYYRTLPSSTNSTDCLPDVDVTEEQDDTDKE